MEHASFRKGELLGPTPLFDQEINEKRKLGYSVLTVPFVLEEEPTLCADNEATIPVKVKIHNIAVKTVPLSVRYFRLYDAALAKAEASLKVKVTPPMTTELPKPLAFPPPRVVPKASPLMPHDGDPDALDELLAGLQTTHELLKEKLEAMESYDSLCERVRNLESEIKTLKEVPAVDVEELESKLDSILEHLESTRPDLSKLGQNFELVLKPKSKKSTSST